MVTFESIKDIAAENIAILFTFCDTQDMKGRNNKGEIKGDAMIKVIKQSVKSDVLNQKNEEDFFYFRGGKNEPTTQNELLTWIEKICPTSSKARINEEASVVNVLKSVEQTGDNGLIECMKEQMKSMSLMYENMITVNNQQHKEQMAA